MQEVRVESLEGLEVQGRELRLSANSTSLSIIFAKEVWDHLLASAPASEAAELRELKSLREQLEAFAREHSFITILEGVRCGEDDPALEYDLVLRPDGLLAVTTGYHFAPVVGADLMYRVRACLEGDDSVEQAYAIGAVADEEALAAHDDNFKCLSIRGRRDSTSRFEMAPELWHTLHERLGWEDVVTFLNEQER